MYRVEQQAGERPQLYIHTDLPKPPLLNFYGTHPHRWSKDDVRQWLEWCVEEYALEGVQVDKFACMNGKALCMLTKQNFSERAKNVGDVLFNTLQQRLVAATSPDSILLPAGALYPSLMSPSASPHGRRGSYDGCSPGIGSPASQPDYSVQSPLAAASPPLMKPYVSFGRQISMPARPCMSAYQSRSPSPGSESPINLSTNNSIKHSPKREATYKVTSEATQEATSRVSPKSQYQPSPRHSLTIPITFGRRLTPSPPPLSTHRQGGGYGPRLRRQVSEGGAICIQEAGSPQSPRRRPSPSFGTPEPAHKITKLSSGSHGMSSPLLSPNYIMGTHPFCDGSPEAFQDIQKKLAITRLDSKEDLLLCHNDNISPSPQSPFLHLGPGLTNEQQIEIISDPEEGTGSDLSMLSGSESPIEDGTSGILHNGLEGSQYSNQHGGQRDVQYRVKQGGEHGSQHAGQHGGQHGRLLTAHGQQPYLHAKIQNARHNLQIPVTVKTAETSDDFYGHDKPDNENGQGDTKLLWEFIYQLLRSSDHAALLRWEDEERRVFRILNPSKLAYLWGLQKSRENMTYEKLSRALRYYYRMNIIVKEPHRRLTYRFVNSPEHIQRGQKGAKPGVTQKRRSLSSSPSDVHSPALYPSPMTSTPNATNSATQWNAKQPEITAGPVVFKQEVETTAMEVINNNNTSVFPTSMAIGSVVKQPYPHESAKHQLSVPETRDLRPEHMSGSVSGSLIVKSEAEADVRPHSTGNSGLDTFSNIPMATEHLGHSPLSKSCGNLVIKRDSPLLSLTNNNTECNDHNPTSELAGTPSSGVDTRDTLGQ